MVPLKINKQTKNTVFSELVFTDGIYLFAGSLILSLLSRPVRGRGVFIFSHSAVILNYDTDSMPWQKSALIVPLR